MTSTQVVVNQRVGVDRDALFPQEAKVLKGIQYIKKWRQGAQKSADEQCNLVGLGKCFGATDLTG